jgi:hypothetical protein
LITTFIVSREAREKLKARSRKSLIEDASDLRTSLFAISLIFGTEAAISMPVIATTNSVSVSENPRESLGLNW